MSDEPQDRLSDEDAKQLIKTIEEVEKEEADRLASAAQGEQENES